MRNFLILLEISIQIIRIPNKFIDGNRNPINLIDRNWFLFKLMGIRFRTITLLGIQLSSPNQWGRTWRWRQQAWETSRLRLSTSGSYLQLKGTVVVKLRDIDAGNLTSLQDNEAFGNLHCVAIDEDFNSVLWVGEMDPGWVWPWEMNLHEVYGVRYGVGLGWVWVWFWA